MILIPAGSYRTGINLPRLGQSLSSFYEIDRSWFFHEIGDQINSISGFLMDENPVTNSEFRNFVDSGGYKERAYWCDRGWEWRERVAREHPPFLNWQGWNSDSHPVTGVTWFEASAFAKWRNARLPSELEWEIAARGHDDRFFPWGNSFLEGEPNTSELWMGRQFLSHEDWKVNFFDKRPWREKVLTTSVRSRSSSNSYFGISDMGGNVWEWCSDVYSPKYREISHCSSDSAAPEFAEYVLRGGSFGYPGWSSRVTERGHHIPTYQSLGIGFRCVF